MLEERIIEADQQARRVLAGEGGSVDMSEFERVDAVFAGRKRKMWRAINRQTRPRRYYWVAAAAVVVLVVGVWWMFETGGGQQQCLSTAMLVLDDGREIALRGDTVLTVNGVEVEVSQGRVRYSASNQTLALCVPRGVEPLSVELSDGSTVLLNSGSRLSYPARFEGATREVELTGEAFFEVAHNKKHPFVVRSGAMTTTVLGTTFNVSAYTDDPAITTTLVTGSVRIDTKGGATQTLTPSMQAVLEGGGLLVQHVDANAATAWREGVMVLDETDLQEIMRTLSRWYDIEVVWEGAAAQGQHNFTARLCRAEGLSRALETLEMLGAPKIEVTENRILIHQQH